MKLEGTVNKEHFSMMTVRYVISLSIWWNLVDSFYSNNHIQKIFQCLVEVFESKPSKFLHSLIKLTSLSFLVYESCPAYLGKKSFSGRSTRYSASKIAAELQNFWFLLALTKKITRYQKFSKFIRIWKSNAFYLTPQLSPHTY